VGCSLGKDRRWAVESADGLGKLLAQQLVAAGEDVVDVPPTLAARVRLLGSTKAAKNDPNDALATAVAGLRHCGLRAVRVDDHAAVIRMLVDRYDDLTGLRTQAACRLHVALRELIAGGAPKRLSADRAARMLRSVRPVGVAEIQRKRLASELLDDLRASTVRSSPPGPGSLTPSPSPQRHSSSSTASARSWPGSSSVTSVTPAGSPERFACYNGTAPIEASSGPTNRHRLNPRGNRKLNHAIHMSAVTQVRHDTPGRVYYQRKLTEGKSKKEALRALKRRISDAVWRQLQVDLGRR
jgi:transposase